MQTDSGDPVRLHIYALWGIVAMLVLNSACTADVMFKNSTKLQNHEQVLSLNQRTIGIVLDIVESKEGAGDVEGN